MSGGEESEKKGGEGNMVREEGDDKEKGGEAEEGVEECKARREERETWQKKGEEKG